MVDLIKRPNESNIDHHKRLVYGKLVDKTLADADYTEIAEALYGRPYASDVARRMVYGSKRTLDALAQDIEHGVDYDKVDVLAELDAKKFELQKERQKFSDQRREYNKLVSKAGRAEHLEGCLIEAANNLSSSVGKMQYSHRGKCIDTDSEAVLVLCDWHYGMSADNVWNAYNTDICKERVKYVIERAAQKLQLHGCKVLHIVMLGDFVHGAIHVGTRVASEELVCNQLMEASEILAQAIEYVSQFAESTIVHTTYGNHARTVQNKEDSIHADNMEQIVPWWLRQRLKERSDIFIDSGSNNEFIFFDCCGYGVCASHGDLDSVKTSPRLLTTLFQKKYGKEINYILLADKHHRESFEELGVCSMICGSLCGTDEYANNKRLYSVPEQMLLIFSNDTGVDAEYRIKCAQP